MSRPPIPWRAREFVTTTFEIKDTNGCLLNQHHVSEINKVFKEHAVQEERIPQLTKERDNAWELVRLLKMMREEPNAMILIHAEIMKRAPGEHEYDVIMKKIAYSRDWVLTFIEEIERLDSL
jgi:hypothetical protein